MFHARAFLTALILGVILFPSSTRATELRFGPFPGAPWLSQESGDEEVQRGERVRLDETSRSESESDSKGRRERRGWERLTDEEREERWREMSAFEDRGRWNTVSLRTHIGFTLNPDTFLTMVEASYFITDEWAIGPLFQLGLSDDDFLLAATANFRKVGDIELDLDDDDDADEAERFVRRLKPYYQFGAGILFLDEDQRGGGDDDDAGLLLNFGFGFDLYLNDRVSFGSGVLFNFMPSEVLDENFYFSWHVATLSFHF